MVFDREAHRWHQENQGQEDVRKMWERAWMNHTLEKSKRDHHGAKMLSEPPHLQKREGRASVTDGGRAPSALGHQWSAHWMTNC